MSENAREQPPGFATTLVWTVAVACLAAFGAYNQAVKNMQAELATRPPIAVLDVADIATQWKEGSTPSERVTNGLREAATRAHALAAQGYLVLDRQNVLAMPQQAAEGAP